MLDPQPGDAGGAACCSFSLQCFAFSVRSAMLSKTTEQELTYADIAAT